MKAQIENIELELLTLEKPSNLHGKQFKEALFFKGELLQIPNTYDYDYTLSEITNNHEVFDGYVSKNHSTIMKITWTGNDDYFIYHQINQKPVKIKFESLFTDIHQETKQEVVHQDFDYTIALVSLIFAIFIIILKYKKSFSLNGFFSKHKNQFLLAFLFSQ